MCFRPPVIAQPAELDSSFWSRSKAITLNTPNNPIEKRVLAEWLFAPGLTGGLASHIHPLRSEKLTWEHPAARGTLLALFR